jgi:hypothetical protein
MQRLKLTLMIKAGVDSRVFEAILRKLPQVEKITKCVKGLTAVGARRKGMVWEKQLAEDLSLWVSDGADPHVFTKRSGSGGSKRDQRGFSGCCGDLQSDKEIGRILLDVYCVEAKFYEDLSDELWRFFTDQRTPTLQTFWSQVCTATAPYKDRFPLLIVKINNRKAICFCNNHVLCQELNSYYGHIGADEVGCFSLSSLLASVP